MEALQRSEEDNRWPVQLLSALFPWDRVALSPAPSCQTNQATVTWYWMTGYKPKLLMWVLGTHTLVLAIGPQVHLPIAQDNLKLCSWILSPPGNPKWLETLLTPPSPMFSCFCLFKFWGLFTLYPRLTWNSLPSPGWSWTCYVPTSVSQGLWWQRCSSLLGLVSDIAREQPPLVMGKICWNIGNTRKNSTFLRSRGRFWGLRIASSI